MFEDKRYVFVCGISACACESQVSYSITLCLIPLSSHATAARLIASKPQLCSCLHTPQYWDYRHTGPS